MDCSSGFPQLLHDLLESPSQHAFNGNAFDLFSNSFLLKEAVEG